MTRNFLGSLLLFLLAGPALAQPPLSDVDLRPLLRVHATDDFFQEGIPPRLRFFQEEDTLITRGGGLVFLQTESINGGPFTQLIVRGVAFPAELAQLRSTLVAGRVGSQGNCEIDSEGGQSSGSAEVTWYGRGSRRNQFRVIYAVRGTTGLAPCSPELVALLVEVGTFRGVVQDHPTSEVLFSGRS